MKCYLIALLLFLLPVNVMAQDNPIEVTADGALEWNRINKTFIAEGNALITQGSNSISAPKITAFYTDTNNAISVNKVVAAPNATLKQPNETLTADSVTANFESGLLSQVTADKNVIFKTQKETLYGDKATYNAKTRIITVDGNVRIEQDKNILTGRVATFNLNTNTSELKASKNINGGRVRAVFYGNESNKE